MSPIVPYVLFSIAIAIFGTNRKLGFWGYLFGSLLFTPVVGLILVLASDRKKDWD